MYSCSFCEQGIDSQTGYISNHGQFSCISCISTKQGFQYSIASILDKIPVAPNPEEEFIKNTLKQINVVKQKVKDFECKLLAQIKQFRNNMIQFCQCIEVKLNSFQNKHTKQIKQIGQLLIKDSKQPAKVFDFLRKPHFESQKMKFNISKDLNHILIKCKQFDNVVLNFPIINQPQKIFKTVKLSDTFITCLKINQDLLFSCNMYGEMNVNNKNTLENIVKVKPQNDNVQDIHIYKQGIVSVGSQISVWKFHENNLELVKSFGVLGKNVYKFVLVMQKLGMIITTTSLAYDYSIKLWSAQSSVVINFLEGHQGCIRGLTKGQDNQIISFALDNTIRIWSLTERKLLRTIYHHHKIIKLNYCSKLKMMIVFDDNSWITLYNYNFYLKPVASSKWKLSRLTTVISVDQYLRIVTSKAEKIRVFDLYGNKVEDKDLGNLQLRCMELEFDRVWGGTGRGEIICMELAGTKSVLFD